MKKLFCSVLMLCCLSSGLLFSETKNEFNLLGSGEVFKLNPVTDSVLLGSGTLIYGTQLILSKGLKLNENLYQGEFFDLNNVNAFDRSMAHKYNHTVDKISDGLFVCSFALPLVLGTVDKSEWFTCASMYAETLLLAQGIKESIKLAVYRPRPYMYFEGFPEKDVYKEHDWANSFLSGHSTMSFAAATFATYTFWKYNPDSPWRFAVAGGSYALASTIACLRVFGGCHFTSDILCGAALGTACGFLVPFLHTLGTGKKETGKAGESQLSILPMGISFTVSL